LGRRSGCRQLSGQYSHSRNQKALIEHNTHDPSIACNQRSLRTSSILTRVCVPKRAFAPSSASVLAINGYLLHAHQLYQPSPGEHTAYPSRSRISSCGTWYPWMVCPRDEKTIDGRFLRPNPGKESAANCFLVPWSSVEASSLPRQRAHNSPDSFMHPAGRCCAVGVLRDIDIHTTEGRMNLLSFHSP